MFTVAPTYTIPPTEETTLLTQITEEISRALALTVMRWQALSNGQNPSYQLFVANDNTPRFLLKIPMRKGYPAVAPLRICAELLHEADLGDYRIVYANESAAPVPYGFFVQPWLPGKALECTFHVTELAEAQARVQPFEAKIQALLYCG